MIVVITGVPGCGKGKVMELAGKKMDVSILNFGDFMFRMATESGLVKDRDDMRKKIGMELTRAMQKKAAGAIGEEIGKLGENVIIDTHCTIKTPAGYVPGLPFEVLRNLKPDAIVIREVDPASIVERRNRDRATGVRAKRDEEEVSAIQLHQNLNRVYAAAYSAISGSTLKIVIDKKVEEYEFQNAEVAAQALLDVFGFK
jgi:adenylate kinase